MREKGTDQNDGKTAATAFRSILSAAQVLNNGDEIVVENAAGTPVDGGAE